MAEKIIQVIDTAAEELITADLDNLQDLGRLYSCFQKILQEATDHDCPAIAKPAAAAIELIKNAILDEHSNRNELSSILNDTLSALQYLARPGVSPASIKFPQALMRDIEIMTGPAPDAVEPAPQGALPARAPDAAAPSPLTGHFPELDLQQCLLPVNLDENMFSDFLNEQATILDRAEADILLLEKGFNRDALDDVRRIFHTMKSESAVFELKSIAQLCHGVEDMIDSHQSELPIDKLLLVKDWLKYAYDCLNTSRMIPRIPDTLRVFLSEADQPAGPAAVVAPVSGTAYVINTAQEAKGANNEAAPEPAMPAEPPAPAAPEPAGPGDMVLVHMDIDLLADFVSEVQEHIDNVDNRLLVLENNPEDREHLNAVFRVFHTIKGAAGFLALDEISKLAHMTESLLDRARKGELPLSGGRIDIVFEAVDEMKRLVNTIHTAITTGSSVYPPSTTLGQLLKNIQAVATGRRQDAPVAKRPAEVQAPPPESLPPATEMPRGADEEEADQHSQALEAADSSAASAGAQPSGKIRETIKVDSENLDKLIDAIGEMVIIESMIKQDTGGNNPSSPMLLRNISQMDKITRELQQLAMSLRMIPVKATFQKMARVVRDLAKKSGKQIEFYSSGEDTMLDKSVVDRIGDPLIHLVRNSVDHGIELTAQERSSAGKPEVGRIELNAYHKGGNIYIEIIDDGRGLDRDAIVEKAKERGLIRDAQGLSDREIFNFIFLPGFSTATKVTDVSGRGVGMDVVKRTIDDLRGNVEISSGQGRGTVFSLRLPLTLAIIDGMLVRIGSERYILPTLSIVEAVRPDDNALTSLVQHGEMITIRDRVMPFFRLSELFQIPDARRLPSDGIVIVVEDSGKMAGLLVDELLGQQSIVIKNMGASMKGLQGVSGGSILSDGKVGIIIDVAGIVKLAMSRQKLVADRIG